MARRLLVRFIPAAIIVALYTPPAASAVSPETYVVTSDLDTSGSTCGAVCSLRQAINAANAHVSASPDTIEFNIPGVGLHAIFPSSGLSDITDPVLIDATTQPGSGSGPRVSLDGSSAGSADGLVVSGDSASGTLIKGFEVVNFTGVGIYVHGASSSDVTIEGNFVGTDGTSDLGNGLAGIVAGGTGDVAIRGNVISGNGAGVGCCVDGFGIWVSGGVAQITGNLVGTDSTGTVDLGNKAFGIVLDTDGNLVGGTSAADRNIISGNDHGGVELASPASSNIVQGNYIGTDVTGSLAIDNVLYGIVLNSAGTGNLIGGTAAGAGNVISGNSPGVGILVSSTSETTVQGNHIGVAANGVTPLGNAEGVLIGTGSNANLIGGTDPGAGNVIAANGLNPFGAGMEIYASSNANVVQGNFIGTDASNTLDLGNSGFGIRIGDSANQNLIGGSVAGAANVIAHNNADGISEDDGADNRFSQNSIYGNGPGAGNLGIDLGNDGVTANDPGTGDVDTGANDLQNFPEITSVVVESSTTTVLGTLDSQADTTYRVEFFSNPACDGSGFGQGKTFLDAIDVLTDGSGVASISHVVGTALASGSVVTATATDPTGDTSEFSACRTAQGPPDPFACPDPMHAVVQAQPPANLRLNGSPSTGAPTFQSDRCIFLFEEQQDVPLSQDIQPFAPRSTGMAEQGAETVLLAQGRVVSSYVLHADALTTGADLQGSWTFPDRILGVFVGANNLEITDSMVGLAGPGGITYETTNTARGLEFNTVDTLSVPANDPRTLNVRFSFGSTTMDEIRVFTGVGPEDCVPPPTTDIVQAFPPADLSVNGSAASNRPKYESDECLFLFAERQNVSLPQDINPSAPTTENIMTAHQQRRIPQGTVVDGYIIHGDRIGSPATGVRLEGTWTFPEPILGISAASDGLAIGDGLVGLSTLTYDPVSGPGDARGAETGDFIGIVPGDPYSIRVELEFDTIDEIRVWTGVINPPNPCPPGTPILEEYPPADLSLDGADPDPAPTFEDACIYLFEEAVDVPLSQTINPVAPKTSGNMVSATPKTRTIPQGTIVSSYLLHADFPGPSPDPTGTTIGGTWTFDDPILAVSYTQSGLATGDNLVGHPGITYEHTSTARGLETGTADSVKVSPTDPNTLIVNFAFNAMDEIRVWTGVINPPNPCPPGTPILEEYPPADLSLDGADPDPAPTFEDACIYLFEEAVDVPLSQTINPVAPKTSGNMVSATPKTRTIPQGTIVSSYLLHADFPGPSPDPTGTTIGGTWTFDDPILAVSYTQSGLATGDNLVGHPGITYEHTSTARGLETGTADSVKVSPTDPNTLIVNFAFNAMDEIRVWTGVINPPNPCPPGTPILEEYPPADLSLDGADPDPAPTFEDACIYLFEEAVDVPLSQTINPVAPKTSGNMVSATPKTRTIPQGTIVSSYLLHADFPGPSPDPTGTTIGGTWTFDDPILAVSYTQSGLATGDNLVGHPGITYEHTSTARGLETGTADSVKVSPTDPNTLIVNFAFNAMDEIRVWTGVINPPICDPSPTNPIVAAFPPADLSQDGADPDPALAYEHDACLFVFDEGEHTLSQAVNPVAPKTTNMVVANPGVRRIPAGTIVETFLIHGDAVGPTPSPTGAEITATWTFDEPILAVSYRRDGLLIGDGLVGHPAITYDTTSSVRGLEVGTPDSVRVSPSDPNTLLMTFAYNAMDEIRVWTGVIGPQPGTIRVVKDSTPDSGQDVTFTTTDLDPAEFALDDDGDATLPASMSFSTAPGDGYAVSESVPDGWDLTSATCDDGSPVTNIDVSSGETVTCIFSNQRTGADLRITKGAAPNPVLAGGVLTYTLVATNLGPAAATGVTVTDVLPASVTYVSATTTVGSCSYVAATTTVTCAIGSLANGANATITIRVRPQVAGALSNTATIGGTEGDPDPTNNTATVSTTVNPSADLRITKGAAPNPVLAGGVLTYTLVATNLGPAAATGVTVTDVLPASVTYVSATTTVGSCSYVAATTTVTCAIGSLANGANATITIRVRPQVAGALSNTATIGGTEGDPDPTNNTATVSTTVNPSADLRITKGAAPNPVLAGGVLTYTLVATNLGPAAATGVTVTDVLPASVTYVSATTTVGSCSYVAATTTVTCAIGSLANGANATITIRVRPQVAGALSNTATIGGTEGDPDPTNNTATVSTTVNPSADLRITKGAAPNPVLAGGVLTYTLVATNLGPAAATGVTVTDVLPASVTYVSATTTVGSCSYVAATTTVTCAIGSLANGANATITIRVRPQVAGALSNTATIGGTEGDPDPTNNTATVSTTVNPSADLRITKGAAPNPVLAGGVLTYTLVATNLGPAAATGVTVTDVLPASVTYVSATTTVGSCSYVAATTTVTCAIGSLANGANATITIRVRPQVAGALSNTATIGGTEGDPDPTNNTATVSTTVNPGGDLSVTKTASIEPAHVGQALTYTIVVRNDGPYAAVGVTLTDDLPKNAGYGTPTTTAGTCTIKPEKRLVTCNLGTIQSGSFVTVTIVIKPTSKGTITNTVSVKADSPPDPNMANNTAIRNTTVLP